MSICTPRACPSFGRNSEYGKREPIMSSVSHSAIKSQLGLVPSKPIEPVTKGNSSGSAALPSSALATPAPSSSATSITSSRAPSAPAPTRIATLLPAFSRSAACCRSCSVGTTRCAITEARVHGAMFARRLLDGLGFLEIVGNDDAGDCTFGDRNPHRTIHHVPHLRGHGDQLDVFGRDVLEQRGEVHFLLV